MRKKRKQIFITLFLLLVLSFLLFLNNTLWHEKDTRMYNISIITRGRNSESLMIMKQGMDQAASEMNVNISFVTLSEDNNIEEQKELIEREIKNKADAIVISPADYENMAEPIEDARKKIPVILFESTIKSERTQLSISCDNYKLGASLGEELIKNGDINKNIAIIRNELKCSSIKERYDGFMSVMSKTKNNCVLWNFSEDKQSTYYNEAKSLLNNNNINVIVIFDGSLLENIAQAKKDLMSINGEKASIKIYGTGSTSKILSFLEEKVVNATAIQNEFNVGYLSIKSAVYKINKKDMPNNIISSTVINTENMYSEENQRLLFPFVR